MNDQQLITRLRTCKNGMFVIPYRSDIEHVHDLWDAHVGRRDRRTLTLTVTTCGTGMVANVSPREGLAKQRKDATVAATAFVLVMVAFVVLFSMFAEAYQPAPYSAAEARHDCVRELGEECKL